MRKETLTGGEEVLQRAGEVSRDRERPARAKMEVVLITVVPVRVSCLMPRETRGWVQDLI